MAKDKEKSHLRFGFGKSKKPAPYVPPIIGAPTNVQHISGNSGPIQNTVELPSSRLAQSTASSLSTRDEGTPDQLMPPKPQPGSDSILRQRYSALLTEPIKPSLSMSTSLAPPSTRTLSSESNRPSRESARVKISEQDFEDPDFKAGIYVAQLLGQASESQIVQCLADLERLRKEWSEDTRNTVYRNPGLFINTSKEVAVLATEMQSLRSVMSNLATIVDATVTSSESALDYAQEQTSSARNRNRSSVADLNTLWNSHLEVLWKRVENAEFRLPMVPGRHILYESGRWLEVHPVTLRHSQSVHIVLLNDHMMVAGSKKTLDKGNKPDNREDGPTHSIIHLWSLEAIMIAETELTRPGRSRPLKAINVQVRGDNFYYDVLDKPERQDELIIFLRAYREAKRNLSKAKNAGPSSASGNGDSAIESLSMFLNEKAVDSTTTLSAHVKSDIESNGNVYRPSDIDAKMDKLDISIALHEFDDAVASVTELHQLAKGVKSDQLVQDLITAILNIRIYKVANRIIKNLVDEHARTEKTKRNVAWLDGLQCRPQARTAFLGARTDIIRKRIRQCIFEGDLYVYVYQISLIYFTLIKNTIETYYVSFVSSSQSIPPSGHVTRDAGSNTGEMSVCIAWAQKHVKELIGSLECHFKAIVQGEGTWVDCMKIIGKHSQILKGSGVTFEEEISRLGPIPMS